MVCDSLKAPVTYKLDGRWELGDFLQAAQGHYGKLLKKAKSAAQSWGDREFVSTLGEIDSTFGQICTRLNTEQWAVNANVHYNNWANFTLEDFRPVVEAFQDLYGHLTCRQCEGYFYVMTRGSALENVRCSCGQVSWNLQKKKGTS